MTPARPPLPRWFLALAAFALGARVALWLAHGASPFGHGLLLDEDAYWRWAGVIADGAWAPSAAFAQGPLYPYLLGAARAMVPGLTPSAVGAS